MCYRLKTKIIDEIRFLLNFLYIYPTLLIDFLLKLLKLEK